MAAHFLFSSHQFPNRADWIFDRTRDGQRLIAHVTPTEQLVALLRISLPRLFCPLQGPLPEPVFVHA